MSRAKQELKNLTSILRANQIIPLGHVRDHDEAKDYPVVFCRLIEYGFIMCAKKTNSVISTNWDQLKLDPNFYHLKLLNGVPILFTRKGKDVFKKDKIDPEAYIQIVEQLSQLHSLGIIHGDVKLENIVQVSDKYYLIDFDTCYQIVDSVNDPQSFVKERLKDQHFGTLGIANSDALLGMASFRMDLFALICTMQDGEYDEDKIKQLIVYYYELRPWDRVDWDRVKSIMECEKL